MNKFTVVYFCYQCSWWLSELTALIEVDAVVVDVCGEQQETRQRQTVLQRHIGFHVNQRGTEECKTLDRNKNIPSSQRLKRGSVSVLEKTSRCRREPLWGVFRTACKASPGRCPSSPTSAEQTSTWRCLERQQPTPPKHNQPNNCFFMRLYGESHIQKGTRRSGGCINRDNSSSNAPSWPDVIPLTLPQPFLSDSAGTSCRYTVIM